MLITLTTADVGGFFGNPEPEMLVRWYQVGAFNPFFRAHAHIDTKRREPYLLDDPYKTMIKEVIRLRYTLLPVWYTAFHEATVNGMPIVRYGLPCTAWCDVMLIDWFRPHFVEYPKDENGFSIDDQYFIGSSGLLVKPITAKDVTETTMYLPDNQV